MIWIALKIARHRLLQRKQRERFFLDVGSHRHDSLMVRDHLFGGADISL